MHMKRILIVGAGGQIGSELTVYLRKIYGDHNVVATDMRECKALGEAGPFEVLNALDATAMASVVARYHIDTIFNLVALLSAVGERQHGGAEQLARGGAPAPLRPLHAQFDRRLRALVPQGQDPTGHDHAAHDHLRHL